MNTQFYNTAAENILYNCLNTGYKFAIVSSKNLLVSKLQENFPFKVVLNDSDILTIYLGEIKVQYRLMWETKENNLYYLKDIQIYEQR